MNAFVDRFHLGDVHGPRIAIKDCIDIGGMPTRAGSPALVGVLPARHNAAVVDALVRAGWHIVGKTTMHELAYGMTGINPWAGTPLNPQDATRIPGGSSSGSAAAVGSGEVDAALGSDTGGSIRLPAACCGVPGLKPTFGRVSRRGAWPRESSLDCVGPFARNALVMTGVMQAIAPDFDATFAARPLADARVGIVAAASDAPVEAALAAALDAAGWLREQRVLPGLQAAFEAAIAVINQETWTAFGHLLDGGRVGADVAGRLRSAGATTDEDRQRAERVRLDFIVEVDRALEGVDALVLPTLPSLPPTLAEVAAGHGVLALSRFVRPFNLSGHPALSYPIPVPGAGALPLKAGLQLVGRKGEDERLCALALHLEHALQASPPSPIHQNTHHRSIA
jgi:amidase